MPGELESLEIRGARAGRHESTALGRRVLEARHDGGRRSPSGRRGVARQSQASIVLEGKEDPIIGRTARRRRAHVHHRRQQTCHPISPAARIDWRHNARHERVTLGANALLWVMCPRQRLMCAGRTRVGFSCPTSVTSRYRSHLSLRRCQLMPRRVESNACVVVHANDRARPGFGTLSAELHAE